MVLGAAKVLGALRSPLWFETVMATAVMTAAAPIPIISVPVPISWAGFTPAGLPGVSARSAAKAEEPTIAATVTAATTLLRPCIGFPRYLMGDTCPKLSAKSTSLSQFLFDCCQKALPHRSWHFSARFRVLGGPLPTTLQRQFQAGESRADGANYVANANSQHCMGLNRWSLCLRPVRNLLKPTP